MSIQVTSEKFESIKSDIELGRVVIINMENYMISLYPRDSNNKVTMVIRMNEGCIFDFRGLELREFEDTIMILDSEKLIINAIRVRYD